MTHVADNDLLAAHADWSVDPRKRWIATARREGGGRRIAPPAPVGDAARLLDRLRGEASAPGVLGLDLPLGLPRGYAARHACALAPLGVLAGDRREGVPDDPGCAAGRFGSLGRTHRLSACARPPAMTSALRKPRMTRDEFFSWAETQDVRYEFDGFQPVAMTGGTVNHSRITGNVHAALRARLRGTGCEPLGPDAGVATIGDTVRYPDALVTCTKTPGTARVVPGVVVVFEVLSPTSGRADRIEKLREYRAVHSIRRYLILEHASIGLTVFERANPEDAWTAVALTAEDMLRIPEIGIEIPVAELYANVDLAPTGEQERAPDARAAPPG